PKESERNPGGRRRAASQPPEAEPEEPQIEHQAEQRHGYSCHHGEPTRLDLLTAAGPDAEGQHATVMHPCQVRGYPDPQKGEDHHGAATPGRGRALNGYRGLQRFPPTSSVELAPSTGHGAQNWRADGAGRPPGRETAGAPRMSRSTMPREPPPPPRGAPACYRTPRRAGRAASTTARSSSKDGTPSIFVPFTKSVGVARTPFSRASRA